jgi:hypothetical protein
MNSFQITNQNLSFITENKNKNNNSISPKRESRFPLKKFNYGSKIREKKNYILYASGTGYERPEYEVYEKGKTIRIIKNKYDISNKYTNRNYKKFIEYEEDDENALSNSDNYRYKETKNIKNENPNLKITTIHKRLGSPRQSRNMNKKIRIKKTENYYCNEGECDNDNPNSRRLNLNLGNDNNDNNEQIRILKENKSSDYLLSIKNRKQKYTTSQRNTNGELIQEIIDPDNDYYYNDYQPNEIQTTKDYNSKRNDINTNKYFNNENNIYSKHKIIRLNKKDAQFYNHDNNKIYHNEQDKKNYEKEPYYIGNYGDEDNYESMRQYKKNEDYSNKNRYGYAANDKYQNNKYVNSREYERYDNYCMNDEENEYIDDISEIKKINCPLHGKISIIIHKNQFGCN